MARSITWLLLAGLLLGGGFAAGFLVGHGGNLGTAPVVPDLRHGPPARDSLLPPPRIAESEGGSLEGTHHEQLVPLREALARIPDPVVEHGDGVITGVVRTEDGEPLAGVSIRADPRLESRMPSSPAEADLAAQVRAWVLRHREILLSRRTATTGADGTFQLAGLLDATHTVDATREGYTLRRTDAVGSNVAQPGATLVFEARRVYELEVDLTMPDGSVPPRARVRFQSGTSSRSEPWRPDSRRVRVDPGIYEVTASAGEAREFRSEPVRFSFDPEEEPPVLRLSLKPHPVLRGRLQLPENQSFGLLLVRIALLPQGRSPDPALLGPEARYTLVHPSSPGRVGPDFTFEDLRPGRYLLGVAMEHYGEPIATRVVDLGEELLDVVLDVPPLEAEETLGVWVLDPDGDPIRDATPRTGYVSPRATRTGPAQIVRLEDGSMRMVRPRRQEAEDDGTWWLCVEDRRYGARQVQFDPDQEAEIEIRFREPVATTLQVAGIQGSRYAGRVEALLRLPDGRRSVNGVAKARVEAGGMAHFGAVQPGRYDLVLSLDNTGPFGFEVLRTDVEVPPSPTTLRATLPTLYVVELENLVERAHLRSKGVAGPARGPRGLVANEEGRATVDGLPAGTYRVTSGNRYAEFTVPGATTVRLLELTWK